MTEDMADSQLEGWMRLGKLQEQVTEKYPNVQVIRISKCAGENMKCAGEAYC